MAKNHLKKNLMQTCQYEQKSQNNSSPTKDISKKFQVRILTYQNVFLHLNATHKNSFPVFENTCFSE